MELKFSTRITVNGNTTFQDEMSRIINYKLDMNISVAEIGDNLVQEIMMKGDYFKEALSPLELHGVKFIDFKTDKVTPMVYQDYPIGSINYSFTYEVSSFWYECINTFPNREFLIVAKDSDQLISYTAKDGIDVTLLR